MTSEDEDFDKMYDKDIALIRRRLASLEELFAKTGFSEEELEDIKP